MGERLPCQELVKGGEGARCKRPEGHPGPCSAKFGGGGCLPATVPMEPAGQIRAPRVGLAASGGGGPGQLQAGWDSSRRDGSGAAFASCAACGHATTAGRSGACLIEPCGCDHGESQIPFTPWDDVREFHQAMGLVVGSRPQILDGSAYARRVRLILEEMAELAEAHAAGDLPEFADALADLVWVVIGTGVEAGIPQDLVWAEVRRANMAKAGGKLDASGKLQKPPGWKPPDQERVLRSVGWLPLKNQEPDKVTVSAVA